MTNYNGIEIPDAMERDKLIFANLSDAQEMIRFGQEPEALQKINDVKKLMLATRELIESQPKIKTMNTPQFTEAPWTVSDRKSSIKIVAPNGYVIASLYKEAGSPHILPNANIMAAAPDMYVLIKDALETAKLKILDTEKFIAYAEEIMSRVNTGIVKPKEPELVREIVAKWCIEDVQGQAENRGYKLTDEQASEILQAVKNYHDASIGINWENIDYHTDTYIEEHKIQKA